MPLIDNKKWSNVAIIIVMKKTVTNMYYVLPRISFGAADELLDIYMKNASFRMGDQLKEWEPALEQLLEPEVAMSYINITPDEIRLASKKISLGGGLVVEGPNVSVNQLSAKRMQLGDNFFFEAGGEQALDSAGEPLYYPDGTPEMTEEKLLIKKVNIGQIEALNDGIPNPNISKPLDQFISELDEEVSQKAEDRLNQEVDLLDEVIAKVEEKAKDSMLRLSNISMDGMISGVEKIQLAKEIVDLESMATILIAQVRGFNANHQLIDPPIDYQTLENDVKELRTYLMDVVKITETEVKNGYTYYTDTVVDNSVFNSHWDKAHQGYSNLMKNLQAELQIIADRADENGITALEEVEVAKGNIIRIDEAVIVADKNAKEGLLTVKALSDDDFLSDGEKSILYTTWVELRDSVRTMILNVEGTDSYTVPTTDLKRYVTDVPGGPGNVASLENYLKGSAGMLKSDGTLNVGIDYKLEENIKVYGSYIDGRTFDEKWKKAYDVRQEFLNALSNESKKQLELSEKNAIVAAVGKYDPNVLSIAQGKMLLYTEAELDGKVKNYIENNALYELSTQGVDGSNCIDIAVQQFRIAWLHPFPIENVHLTYGMQIRINPRATDTYNYGFVCLDEGYKIIKTITKTTPSLPAGVWYTSPTWHVSDITVETFHPNTKYVRPFLKKNNGGDKTRVDMVRFYNAQDEVNQGTVEDIFADNKVTPDEKKTLKGIYEQVKEEHSEMVNFITTKMSYVNASGVAINGSQWSEYSTYVASYGNFKIFYDGILSDMNSTTDVSTVDRNKISALQASFYKNKKILEDKIQTQIKEDLVAVDKTAEIREGIIKEAVKNGILVLSNTLIMDKNMVYSAEEKASRGEFPEGASIPGLQIMSIDQTPSGVETRNLRVTKGGIVFTRNGTQLSSIRNVLIKDYEIKDGVSIQEIDLSGWQKPNIVLAPTKYTIPVDARGMEIRAVETSQGSQKYKLYMQVHSAELKSPTAKFVTGGNTGSRTASFVLSEVAREVIIDTIDLHTIISGIHFADKSDTFGPFGGCDSYNTGDGVTIHELWGRADYEVIVTATNSFTQDTKMYKSYLSHAMGTGTQDNSMRYRRHSGSHGDVGGGSGSERTVILSSQAVAGVKLDTPIVVRNPGNVSCTIKVDINLTTLSCMGRLTSGRNINKSYGQMIEQTITWGKENKASWVCRPTIGTTTLNYSIRNETGTLIDVPTGTIMLVAQEVWQGNLGE
ncbi:MAG: hypothetical protein ACRC6B_10625 [Fusobacteriaceae bacterium]